MKKSFFYLLNLSFAAMMLLTACSETNKSGGDYLAVKVSGDNNWSILDVNTGDFIAVRRKNLLKRLKCLN
jgi:hypothetical protein